MLYNGSFTVRAHLCNYFFHEAIILLNFLLVVRDASMMTCVCIYIYVFDESSLGGFTVGGLTCMVELVTPKTESLPDFPYPSE